MRTSAVWIGAYVVNAIWQLPLMYVAALCVCRLAKSLGAQVQHTIWVCALAMSAMLPALSFSISDVRGFLSGLLHGWGGQALDHDTHVSVVQGKTYAHAGLGFSTSLLESVAVLYFVVMMYFAVRLLWGLQRTARLRSRSQPLMLPESIADRWRVLCLHLNVRGAEIAASPEVCGPVTLGVRSPLMLVPEGWIESAAEEDFEAAAAHELAHMRRQDFAKNLVYQLLSLPVAFHPIAHWMIARVGETREMICDAEAAQVSAGTQRYAASLLRLAASFVSDGQTSTLHAIGIFDANTLERRLMNLKTRKVELRLVQRVAIGVAAAGVAVASCASAVALRMNVSLPQEGTAQAAPQEQAAPSFQSNAVRVSAAVESGQILSRVDPVYPEIAKKAGVSGAVVLAAIIGVDGKMQQLRVLSGPPMLFDSTLEAVRQWVYRPYLLNGQPTEVQTTITVNYQLPAE